MITRPIKSERSLRRYRAAGWRIERKRAGDDWREIDRPGARKVLRGTYGSGMFNDSIELRAVQPEGTDIPVGQRRYALTWADGQVSSSMNNELECLPLLYGVTMQALHSLHVGDSCHDPDGDKWTRVQ